MTGYPQYVGPRSRPDDLLKCEIHFLRTVNLEMLLALEAVAADIGDPDSDSWVDKPVKLQVLRAIAHARETAK